MSLSIPYIHKEIEMMCLYRVHHFKSPQQTFPKASQIVSLVSQSVSQSVSNIVELIADLVYISELPYRHKRGNFNVIQNANKKRIRIKISQYIINTSKNCR